MNGGGGFLDRAPAHVDARPAVLGAQTLGRRDLLGNGLAIDVGRIGLLRVECEQAVLPDLHDALGVRIKTDDQRLHRRLQLRRRIDAGHQRYVRGLDAAIGEINAGRGFRGSRHPHQDHVGLLEILRVLPVVVHHGEIQRVDAAEIIGVQRVLAAYPRCRFGSEITLKKTKYRPQNGQARQAQLAAARF